MNKTTFERTVNEIETALRGATSDCYLYGERYYLVTDRTARAELIRRITDDYVAANDKTPDGALLERLADVMLYEELTDRHPDKVTREEYPFFSEHQTTRRHNKEVSLWLADTIGADGRDYRKQKRRMRSKHEHKFMDTGVRNVNSARRQAYKKALTPSPISNTPSEPFISARQQASRWREFIANY